MKKTHELFDLWNDKKKSIEFNRIDTTINYKIGEFVWYYEGVNIGKEISKDGYFIRPCLILHSNIGNGLYLILPFTTKYKNHMKQYYFILHNPKRFNIIGGWGLINSIKIVDRKRLLDKLSSRKANKSIIKKIILEYIKLISLK